MFTDAPTQAQIDDSLYRQRQNLSAAAQRVLQLKEQVDWLSNYIDAEDAYTFNREDGVTYSPALCINSAAAAYSLALGRPSATACAYINEQQLNMIRARSRAFCTNNPYWLGLQHNIRTHVIGKGHVYLATAKSRQKSLPEGLIDDVQDEIATVIKVNRYREVQAEKLRRLGRDGEFFLRFFENHRDGTLRVRFVEPLRVWTPPGKSTEDDVWFGIQFKGDYEDPQGYYINLGDFMGLGGDVERWKTMVPADEIQHRKVMVDRSSPRGLPMSYGVQQQLEQALKTLKSMGKLVDFRVAIALIRKRVNAVLGTVQPLLNAQAAGQMNMAGGQVRNVYQYPAGTILDTNDQAIYEFPSQNIETDKIVSSVQADLRAVAASFGLADYLVSADVGNSSYSGSMVAEGPVVRTFESMQQDLIEDDLEVMERALRVAADHGRLPSDVLERVKITAQPPALVGRNRIQDTQADQILNQMGVLSIKTCQLRNGLDPDEEDPQVKVERDEAIELAKKQAEAQVMAGANGAVQSPGKFAQRPNQPSQPQKVTARPFAKDDEPRQKEDVAATTPVFFYGTLLSTRLRKHVLDAEPMAYYAILPDFERKMVPKWNGWTIDMAPGERVMGIRVDLTPEEIAKCDEWEGHDNYRRQPVILADATEAQAYVYEPEGRKQAQ